jgi:signal transduction histidine kinase
MILNKTVSLWMLILVCTAVYSQKDNISYYRKELKAIKKEKDFTPKDTSYIKLLNTLSTKYLDLKSDTLAVLATEAFELSKSIDYEMGMIKSLSNLAIYEFKNGDIEKSMSINKEILQKLDIQKFPELGATIYNVLGQTYFKAGNTPEAYKHTFQSLILAKKTNNKELITKLNSNMGDLFTYLEDYDEALEFYTLALDGFDAEEQNPTKSSILANLGHIYLYKNNHTKALELLDRSLPMLEKANNTEMLTKAYLAYGAVYFHTNRYADALHYLKKANLFDKPSKDTTNKAFSFLGLGTIYLALNNITKADEYLNLSLNLYESINNKKGIANTSKALYELNKKKKSEEKALYFLEQAKSYSDSVNNEKSLRDISMWRAKTQFEMEKVILQRQTNLEVAEQKKHIQWAGLGLFLTIVIAILVFSVNKSERKLNKELALQSQNLSEKENKLNKINTNQDKLFSIVGHDLRGPIVSLKQLLGLALKDETGVQHFYTFGPKLKKDVDHIYFTLENLLNWGKTQMYGEPLYPVQINVKEELLAIEYLFRDILDKKSVVIHKEILEGVTLLADANHFKIIFRNLISNALKFTPNNGSIWLTSTEEKDSVVILVKDNGIGMSEEVVHKIFDSSEYFTTFGTNHERGTGLGLTLCREMVHKNNGEIWVRSSPGQGSTFYIRFPKEPLV